MRKDIIAIMYLKRKNLIIDTRIIYGFLDR